MAPKVERVIEMPLLKVGEGPHWDIETQSLYCIDGPSKSIHRYVPSTGQHTSAKLEKAVSVIIPVQGKPNQFVIGSGKEINIITWDGSSETVAQIEKIAEPEQGSDNSLNDAKIDPKGRLWIGSVGRLLQPDPLQFTETGSLYSLEKGKVFTHVTGLAVANGLAWNAEIKQFYYIDSMKRTVDAFDYDVEKGTIANRREIFNLDKQNIQGFPDGMTIDEDGNLWVAIFGGFSVLKIDPRKPETLLQKVAIPVKEVTSVAWGGKDLDALYVTSANLALEGKELPPGDNGAVFRITGLETRGLPMKSFEL